MAWTVRDAAEVEALLGQLRAAGCDLDELEVRRADLEDAFLQIMGSASPDEAGGTA